MKITDSAAALVQQVQYRFGGFLAPLNSNLAFGLNRTIPVKFQLSDANSRPVSSLSAWFRSMASPRSWRPAGESPRPTSPPPPSEAASER